NAAVVVVGAGGHGREAVSIARAAGREVLGVLDDGRPPDAPVAALGQVLLGGVGWLREHPGVQYAAALGYPAARRSVVDRAAPAEPETLVHPSAVIEADVTLGAVVLVWPNVTVTVTVRLGRHTHLNVGCSVSHDVVAGDFVTVGPGARVCGAVVLEDDVWVGAGAVILPGVRVGEGAV